MINNISFLDFKRNNKPISMLKRNPQVSLVSFGGGNIRPLAKDTVSFGAKNNKNQDLEAFMSVIHNDDLCAELHNDAQEAKNYVQDIVTRYFENFVYDKKKNPQGIIEPIQGRVKSPGSIKEKVVKKFMTAILPSEDSSGRVPAMITIFSPYSKEGMKQNLRDVPGVRLVVKEDSDNAMDVVVGKICDAIKTEGIVIDKIENHFGEGSNVNPYFTKEQLERIAVAANEIRRLNKLPEIGVLENKTPTGYMALHLDIDTTFIGRFKDSRGFYSELQILGSDVAMLKDVEDLCYKLEDGKSIKQKHPSFSPFEIYFKEAYNDTENYPNIRADYKEYTRKAYAYQRNRKPHNGVVHDDTKNWAYAYPTIEQCGLKGKIPPILDFNILARIKRDCEDLNYIYYNPQKILDEFMAVRG